MKRAIATALVLGCLIGQTEAADIYDPNRAPPGDYGAPAAPQVFNWTGLYVGLHAGYAWGTADNSIPALVRYSLDPNGVVGGLYGGFNQMLTYSIVAGIEADLTLSGQEARRLVNGAPATNGNDWYGTVRGRVGLVFDRIMPFVTAGLAFGDVNARFDGNENSTATLGYALGLGIEGAITNHLTARVEYQYLDFGRETFPVSGLAQKTVSTSHILRAGVGYKF